jgi:hypothetical protein
VAKFFGPSTNFRRETLVSYGARVSWGRRSCAGQGLAGIRVAGLGEAEGDDPGPGDAVLQDQLGDVGRAAIRAASVTGWRRWGGARGVRHCCSGSCFLWDSMAGTF